MERDIFLTYLTNIAAVRLEYTHAQIRSCIE